jgi:hypothetical protein
MTTPNQQQEFEAAIQLHIQQAVQAAPAGIMPAAMALERKVQSTDYLTHSGRPFFAKARRLDPEKHQIAEAKFQKLEKAGPFLHGLLLSTWFPSQTARCDHVEITAS